MRQLESTRKACKTSPHGGKHKSLNAVGSCSADEKITGEIRELKELVLGINKKMEELEKKTAEKDSTVYRKGTYNALRLRSTGSLCAGLPCSASNSTSLGKQFTGRARGQPDPAPAINGPLPEVNNDMHCDIETSRVTSSISDAGIYLS